MVEHDNGNHVCFSDGSVFVRQDREYFRPDGTPDPTVAAILAAADAQARRVYGV